ncbi:DUF814 domain-containing protein [Candidatus Woesearchaeota archaeon]|nr:DUF814 domain-containing protein [Candidatus Woesearchaeota archaeon]
MKAIALFSGGLDSLLAIKLIQEQGIDVTAVSFTSPFFIRTEQKKEKLRKIAKKYNFKIMFIELKEDYLKLVRNPPHGHGKNMNPCIDCHAFMINEARKYAEKIKAEFVFTGEVLDERPMSQNAGSLKIVAKQAGLYGKLLRPLSAKHMKETEAEKTGVVDREKLGDIRGRGRSKQFELAEKYGIKEFETPGGGCLLTYEAYSNKLRDLFEHKKRVSEEDIRILKFGRHFRKGDNKIIVGRDEEDNKKLLKLKKKSDYVFELRDDVGPVTLLKGPKTKKAIELAASLTISHSKIKEGIVSYGQDKLNKEVLVSKIKREQIDKLRI